MIVSWLNSILARVLPVLLAVLSKYLTPGNRLHGILQWIYVNSFDWLTRQKSGLLSSWNYTDLENPNVVSRNRLRMVCKSRSFETVERAVKYWSTRLVESEDARGKDKFDLFYLTGRAGIPDEANKWDFILVGEPTKCPTKWESPEFDRSGWFRVALPHHWQLQGFDIPIYTNTGYPFQFDPPRARRNGKWVNTVCDVGCGGTTSVGKDLLSPKELGENTTGLFHRTFTLGEQWTQKIDKGGDRVVIVFEGVDSCLSVWVNGHFVGYSQDSCLSAEFDITEALQGEGEGWWEASHSLAVKASRWCDGSYLEDQDKWWLSGVYREVFLRRRPAVAVEDYEFRAHLEAQEGGAAEVEVEVLVEDWLGSGGAGQAVPERHVRVELFQQSVKVLSLSSQLEPGTALHRRAAAERLGHAFGAAEHSQPVAKRSFVTTVSGVLQSPLLWTAETPHLYTLVLSLFESTNGEGNSGIKCIHVASSRVGLRSVTIDGPDHTLRVNRQSLTIAGVNRHEFDPATGRAISEEGMRADALLLKRLNFNAVRCSHYPNHPYWYELCDELGLFVIDEANIETHGFQLLGQPVGYLAHLPQWASAMGSRVTRMVERTKNHPCVIGWSLGNESGFGPTHDAMAQWLRTRDPLRFVQYESGGSLTSATDIVCPMYQRPDWCREQANVDPQRRPVILCEYAHAMGNSGGCLAQYWRDFRDPALPRVQGGFIWDMKDQGLLLPSSGGEGRRYGYGGDFGDVPNTRQFCCNGVVGPHRQVHPSALEAAHLQAPVEVAIERERQSENGCLRVTSRRNHSTLADLTIIVTPCVASDFCQDAVKFSPFEITLRDANVAPGGTVHISVENYLEKSLRANKQFFFQQCPSGGDFKRVAWLDVVVVCNPTPLSSRWNREGFAVLHTALESYPLLEQKINNLRSRAIPPRPPLSSPAEVSSSVKWCDGTHADLPAVLVHWSNGSLAVVSRVSGLVVRWCTASDEELLASPLEVSLYRAGTDNDRGGTVASYHARWLAAGLDSLHAAPKTNSVDCCQTLADGSVEVIASWSLVPSAQSQAPRSVTRCAVTYLFTPSGAVKVHSRVFPDASLPPIPRCGMRFAVPPEFSAVQWFGLGPHEAYSDRRESAYLGVHHSSVEDLHPSYVFPSECGSRPEPRWLLLKKEQSRTSLSITFNSDGSPNPTSSFSVSRHSTEALESAAHEHELPDEGKVFVHLDGFMMGIGGYDSWSPNVDSQFLFQPDGVRALDNRFTLSVLSLEQ